MKNFIPPINPEKESEKIVRFIRSTLNKTGFKNLVIGFSGGVDSTTSLYLLQKALPAKNIFPIHLPYFPHNTSTLQDVISQLGIPQQNFKIISIKELIKFFRDLLFESDLRRLKRHYTNKVNSISESVRKPGELSRDKNFDRFEAVRLGNIMARTRMVILYDLAKKQNALVCGTENKSEHLLGYFTRFGDEASDLEPIRHLYKTQVLKLAKNLKIPEEIIKARPTAGLWTDQTDEGEFGFSYAEADQVLYLYFEKKISLTKILHLGFKNAKKIIYFAKKNSFKQQTPYTLYQRKSA